MNTPGPILQVAISTPLNLLFDYLPPDDGPAPQPGQRVRVPFGRRVAVGFVIALAEGSELPPGR